jgi:hypothetical protein
MLLMRQIMLISEEQINKKFIGELEYNRWILQSITNSPRKVPVLLITYVTLVTDIILRYESEDFSWALR